MTPRSERPCIRGCLAEGKHYAECPSYGTENGDCTGCAPAKTHNDTLVCETCYRRVRGILRNAPDLLGRLRSLTRQGKAVAYSPTKVPGHAAIAPEQIDAELLDALTEIEANLAEWYRFIDPRTLAGIDDVLSVPEWIDSLWEATLDMHLVDAHGDRHAWSLADAAARWGIERRDRHVYSVAASAEGTVVGRIPIPEPWFDPLIPARDAAKRAEISDRQLRTWVKSDVLVPRAKLREPDGSVVSYFYASQVDAAAELMRSRRSVGRRGRARPVEEVTADTPGGESLPE
ncbi:hypothetical protein LJR045_000969 [Microbacterium sp. LjRoot45]|uniref:hypothetical protein n=1 Tax=Microbacterium sp. LjRoot45 TaxID=3342329 RepID=UPI003ED06B21